MQNCSRNIVILHAALLFAVPFLLSGCDSSQPTSKVSQWWYNAEPEDFHDQSIGGGGRPRQVSNSSNTGMRAGGKR